MGAWEGGKPTQKHACELAITMVNRAWSCWVFGGEVGRSHVDLPVFRKKVKGSIYSSAPISHWLRVASQGNFLVLPFCDCANTDCIFFRAQRSLWVESERSV